MARLNLHGNSTDETTEPTTIRFGVFEINLRTGELRKHGVRIRLAEQSFRILAALLEKPGELVTRDELRQKIWSADTFVDFEQGLNRSVNKVREALGDIASNPRFIETLPGRGYRFIAPVQVADKVDVGHVTKVSPPLPAKLEAPPSNTWKIALASSLVVITGIGVVVAFLSPAVPTLKWTKLTTDNYLKFPPALTDGTRIYFQSSYGGDQFIAQVPVSGGQAARISLRPPAPNFVLHDLSPDGQHLLLSADRNGAARTLYRMRVTDGTAQGLGGIQAVSAVYSPRGDRVAYSTETELWTCTPDGGDRKRLLQANDSQLDSVYWSPDGTVIRFSKQHPVTFEKYAWEIKSDGSGLKKVLPDWPVHSFEPAGWDTGAHSELISSGGGLWAIPKPWRTLGFRARNPIQLNSGDPEFLSPLRFRNDKQTYAIGVTRLGELERFDRQSKVWAPVLEGVSAESAEYSRDGKRIAYVSYPQRALWVRNSDGSQPVQLTNSPMSAVLPHWSPDGTRLAFMGLESPGKICKCYVAEANGGGLRMAAPSDPGSQSDCSWSADGESLAYGLRGGINTHEEVYIRLVNLRSGKVTKLPGSENLFAPRWSPDGSKIAALPWRLPSDRWGLMIYDVRTGRWNRAWDEQADSPVWTSDSKALVFDSGPSSLELHLADRRTETLAERNSEQVGGYWHFIALAADGSPIRTLNRDSRQVFHLDLGR